MGAVRVIRFLSRLLDVDPAGLAAGDVPTWDAGVSKFTMAPGGGAAVDVTLDGNTAGVLALISSGTMTLAGGPNITLSQNGNAVSISGGAGAGVTGISGISASNTVYTSGTVDIEGSGGGITIGSGAGQKVVLSVAAPVSQTVQTQNVIDLTLAGNTAGALALMSSGTVTLAGGNNVTVSQAGNAVTISAFNQSVQPETQTFVGGIQNSQTTYTSGTVNLSVVAGNLTIRSTTGQAFQFSASQTVQTQNVVDLTLAGNTAGALALVSSGTATLVGGNNITLSQAGNAITISGAAQAADTQTAISGIANSQTTYTSGTVSLSELGAITIRSTTGNQFQFSVNSQTNQTGTVYAASNTTGTSSGTYDARTLSIAGDGIISVAASNSGWRISASQSVQTQSRFDMTIAGNSTSAGAGFIEMSSGTVTLAGGNNITISQNGNALTISGPNVAGAQTGISGISASDTLYTSGTVKFSGVGGGITVSSNTGQRVDLSVAAPVAQTNQAGTVYASSNTFGTSSGTYDARTLSIAGSGAVSVAASNSGWVISAPAQTAATGISGIANSQTTYTSGTVSFSELGAITIRSTTGNQFQFSVNSQTVQTQGVPLMGVSTAGNTSGDTTVNSGTRMVFVGSNNITLSQGTAANATTITISGPTAAVQTNQTGSVFASSNTFGTSSGTYDARTLSIAGSGAVSVAASNSGWVISAPVQTNQAGTAYAASNTFGTSSGTYDARTLSIAGDGIISVAASNSGWRISATQSVQTQDVLSVGVSTAGNTAGNTTVNTGSRLVYVGSDLISLSQTTAAGATTITFDATNQNLSVGASTAGNTAGNTTVNTGSRLVFVGSNNITVSQGTAAGATTLTLSGPTTAAQTNQTGNVYVTSNTFGTSSGTYDARTISVQGSGAISVAASNSGWVISAPTQTNQSGNVYASSNTTGTSSGTYDARSLSIAGAGIVSVAASNSGWVVSATQSNQSGNVYASSNTFGTSSGTYDARSLSIAGSGAAQVAASNSGWVVSAPVWTLAGNSTSGGGGFALLSSATISLAGGPNITLSQDGNHVSISAPAPGAASFSVGVSTGGNTAGNTGVTGTRIVFVGSNNITLSQATDATGATITVSGPTAGAFSAGVSTGGNTAGNTGITGTRLVLAVTDPLTLSQATDANGGTVSVNAPNTSSLSGTGGIVISTNGSTISIGQAGPYMSYSFPAAGPLLMSATQGIGASAATQTTVTAWVMPLSVGNDLAYNNLFLAAHNSFSSNSTSISSVNYSYSMGASLGFYTLTGSTMSQVTSFSNSLGFTNATSANATDLKETARVGFGGSSTTFAITGAANISSIMSSINSVRKIPLNWTTSSQTLTRGQYWAVACFSALTGGANQASLSQVGFVSSLTAMGSAYNPPEMAKSTASVTSPYPFLGLATIVNSSNSLMPVSFNTSVITTATAIANSTNFQSLWMQIHSSHSN